MAHYPKDLELIDKYLLDELTVAEQSEFKKRSQDPDFQKELEFHKEIQPVIKRSGREDLKMELKDLEERISKENQPPVQRFRVIKMERWIAVAAIMAGLIFVGNYLFQTQNTNEKIFGQYYEPYPNVVAPIVKSGEESSDFEKAFQFYQLKKYEEAEVIFSKLSKTDISEFYYALTLLELEKINLAIEKLSTISENSEARFQIPAKWYLGLILLKKQQPENGKELIEIVSKSADYPVLQNKAIEILKKL